MRRLSGVASLQLRERPEGSEKCSRSATCGQVAIASTRCPVGTPIRDLCFSIYGCACGRQYIPTVGIFEKSAEARYRLGRERGKLGYRKRQAILDRDGHKCVKCGREDEYLEIHHVVPFCRWGSHDESNLVSLCWKCHRLSDHE